MRVRSRWASAGANHLAVCWGPVLGAKVVTYRTALCLGCVCQLVGILAFGPRSYTIYGGFLRSLRDLGDRPELTLYAIMWALITPVIWQLLAIKRQLLVPPFLGTGEVTSCTLLLTEINADSVFAHMHCIQMR